MELPGESYCYTLAALAMAFVGFNSITLVLRQTIKPSAYQIRLSRLYIHMGFLAAGFAMLTPFLATCGIGLSANWRISSLLIAVASVAHQWIIVAGYRRQRGRLAPAIWINSAITGAVALLLLANAAGWPMAPHLGPVSIGATWQLVFGVQTFLRTFERFIGSPEQA